MPCVHLLQVAELLFSHVWGQWCTDTQLLLEAVAPALAAAQAHAAAPAPQLLLLCFERWMLLLKVGPRWAQGKFQMCMQTSTLGGALDQDTAHLHTCAFWQKPKH